MAERAWRPTEQELERALHELGEQVAYPPTPDLAGAARLRLNRVEPRPGPSAAALDDQTPPPAAGVAASGPVQRPRGATPAWSRLLGYAALALVLLGAAVLAAVPEARNAVAQRLGLRGVTIEQVPFFPAAAPTPSPTPVRTALPAPTPQPAGVSLGLGRQFGLEEARALAPFPVLLPAQAELGAPDEVWLNTSWFGDQVALVYRARPGLPLAAETGVGLLLVQFRARLEPGMLGKTLGPDTRLEQLILNGQPAYWIEGRPHAVFYRDASGNVREDTLRLAGNVLLWEQAGLTLRLESALARDDALRIATSVR
jgi:hypothetical protein